MTTTPNEEPDAPPPPDWPATVTATPVATIPDGLACPACQLPIMSGQTVVYTSTDMYVHSFCWENR